MIRLRVRRLRALQRGAAPLLDNILILLPDRKLFHCPLYLFAAIFLFSSLLTAQINPRNLGLPPERTLAPASGPRPKAAVIRPNAPRPDEIIVRAVTQEVEGTLRRLRGKVQLETLEALLSADEMDYNEDTGAAEARGNVRYQNFESGEILYCARAEYDVKSERGRFYDVSGTLPVELEKRPFVLTSTEPFSFAGKWAERTGNRYLLYDGFLTSCKLPKPWWILRGPVFDIIPNDRAIVRNAHFRVRGVPLLFAPAFYKSLEKQPRRSGFLTPNIGNSTRLGFIFGAGYYWAINRSYDVSYRSQVFTSRGFAHLVEFRGRPTQKSEFDFNLYGVNDRGRPLADGTRFREGGLFLNFNGRFDMGRGWTGFAFVNYLSSFRFRQAFTQTFNEAIFSEVTSVAYVTKYWRGYRINAVYDNLENFQSIRDDDQITIRKLPQIEFISQDRRLSGRAPVWWSAEASAALLRRDQPLFQTRRNVERYDAEPRLMTVGRFHHLSVIPSASARFTHWGSRFDGQGAVAGDSLSRVSFTGNVDIVLPSFARIYETRNWLGDRLKHVVEPRAGFRTVEGADAFRDTIRFDGADLVNDTREAWIGVTNRLYAKKNGATREWASWEIAQRRYFDPAFGGSIRPGSRNLNHSVALVSGFSFLDGPRNYSPVVSRIRLEPRAGLGISWMADYDPVRGGIANSSAAADGRIGNLFLSVGHNHIRSNPVLSPNTNQFRSLVGWGQEGRRGWNAAFFALYDYRLGALQFANTQVTYNTDCCGFSLQWRRFDFGTRFENQFRFALAIANVGSFGTLRKLERFF